MSNEMSVEERARTHSESYDLDTIEAKTWFKSLLKECYVIGYKERDAEVKELKDIILEMARIVEEYPNYFNMVDNMHNLYVEHSKLIERLRQERINDN